MSLLGKAAVAMWWDISSTSRTEFEDWHSHEHFPERMSVPGFNRGSRWRSAEGSDGFFVLYELAGYEVLTSAGYLERLNNPTPWSVRMMPLHRNMVRSQCHIVLSYGGGIGASMATIRVSPRPDQADDLRHELGHRLAALPSRPGLTGAHLLVTDTPAVARPTTEQAIRGMDQEADWIVLITGYDPRTVEAVLSEDLSGEVLGRAGAQANPIATTHSLAYAASSEDVRALGSAFAGPTSSADCA